MEGTPVRPFPEHDLWWDLKIGVVLHPRTSSGGGGQLRILVSVRPEIQNVFCIKEL